GRPCDPMLKERVAELKAVGDRGRAEAERAEGAIERLGPTITTPGPQDVRQAGAQRDTDRRRDHLRVLAQRVQGRRERSSHHGPESMLLRTLVTASPERRLVLECL